MFDKSLELDFPLFGGSSIPFYYRKPEIELDIDTHIKASAGAGGSRDAGSLFHCVDVLQALLERRNGGEGGLTPPRSQGAGPRRLFRCLAGRGLSRSTTPRTPSSVGSSR